MKPNEYTIRIYKDGEYANDPLYFLDFPAHADNCDAPFANGLSPAHIGGLLHELDKWYGDTNQDTEVWALEYQLWARMLLSETPCVMINPRHLVIFEVLENIIGFLKNAGSHRTGIVETYKDMVLHASNLRSVNASDSDCAVVRWPVAPDAVLLQRPLDDAPSALEYTELIKRIAEDMDEPLFPVFVEGECSCAYGFIRDSVADAVLNYEVTTQDCAFCKDVARILNDMTLETVNGTYTCAGVRTKILYHV